MFFEDAEKRHIIDQFVAFRLQVDILCEFFRRNCMPQEQIDTFFRESVEAIEQAAFYNQTDCSTIDPAKHFVHIFQESYNLGELNVAMSKELFMNSAESYVGFTVEDELYVVPQKIYNFLLFKDRFNSGSSLQSKAELSKYFEEYAIIKKFSNGHVKSGTKVT